ncbi:MAG: NB-ARC domain-containing protein, partial [Chloroflexi bacterium]|nr:NB-ARC domain-containing protein [Chloroflexota bacterium]
MTAEPTLPTLRQLIQDHFNLEDLHTLCFDLEIDYEEWGYRLGKSALIVELIKHVRKHNRLEDLLDHLQQQRPTVTWPRQLMEANLGLEPGLPPLPPHFLPREKELAILRQKVLADPAALVAITGQSKAVEVQGMGGLGKSVLAAALAHDEAIRAAFPDGIYWLTVGQGPGQTEEQAEAFLLSRQVELAKLLGQEQVSFTNTKHGRSWLRQRLAGQSCLLILDDVWTAGQLKALAVLPAGSQSHLLLTTRDSRLARVAGAVEHQLEVLDKPEALHLLAKTAVGGAEEPAALPPEAEVIIEECGGLPLALAMVGGLIAEMVRQGQDGWQYALHRLRQADHWEIPRRSLDYPYSNLLVALDVSLIALTDDPQLSHLNPVERYLDLAVFGEDSAVPEAVLLRLWEEAGLAKPDGVKLVVALLNRSLIQRHRPDYLRLHDLQGDYVRRHGGDLTTRHERLLAAYAAQCSNGWATGPDDGYFFQHLAYHLQAAAREGELRRLLLTFAWLQGRLEATDVISLLHDYEWLGGPAGWDDSLRLAQEAILRSAHVLVEDKNQLAGQLLGRLSPFVADNETIATLLAESREWRGSVWLCPLHGNLTLVGEPLLRTFRGHTRQVYGVAVTPDGRLALSTSYDGMVKVWEIATAQELHTFLGHTDRVYEVAVLPAGRLALSWSVDGMVKVWEIATGREVHTLKGHRVSAIAVTPDGRLALFGYQDGAVKVWDISTLLNAVAATGRELH